MASESSGGKHLKCITSRMTRPRASTLSDEQMVHQLRFSSGPQADLPPLALVEFVQIEAEVFRVRSSSPIFQDKKKVRVMIQLVSPLFCHVMCRNCSFVK